MIVPMKHITLFCVSPEQQLCLDRLRRLGAVHLELAVHKSGLYQQALSKLSSANRALKILHDTHVGEHVRATSSIQRLPLDLSTELPWLIRQPLPALTVSGAAAKISAIFSLAETRQALVNEEEHLANTITLYRHFGEFDIDLPGKLAEEGLPVIFFQAPGALPLPPERDGVIVKILGEDNRFMYGVQIGQGTLPGKYVPVTLPALPFSALKKLHEKVLARISYINRRLNKAYMAGPRKDLEREIDRLDDLLDFANAADNMQSNGTVSWITGWLPFDQEQSLRETAQTNSWGLLIRDPGAREKPPTLLHPPRLFRPILSLFRMLNISPGYNESDISLPFFCWFSVFFAMLVNDAVYGGVILALTWLARRKFHQVNPAVFALLKVFGTATVVWGILTNSWFGFHPASLSTPVSGWISRPDGVGDSHMMLICFTLGALHLSIARLWNAVLLFPDRAFLAQVGWVGIIWFMFFAASSIVGVVEFPGAMKAVLAVSLVLTFLFTATPRDLKADASKLIMLPINIVGCLGDIVSYIRLFAVSLASAKVAENFNNISLGIDLPLVAKVPVVILCLLAGHGLNFAMTGLSVLVHAVRLNTLEFSNHKGILWTGVAFKPFTRRLGAFNETTP